jgi:hypothetical protein
MENNPSLGIDWLQVFIDIIFQNYLNTGVQYQFYIGKLMFLLKL